MYPYNFVKVYRMFNLGIITRGKHLQYILPKFVYVTSQGFYELDSESCRQKQLLSTCDDLYTSLTARLHFLNPLFQNTTTENFQAEIIIVLPPIVYKYTPSGLIKSNEMKGTYNI